MERKTRKVTKAVKVLSDPHPTFVSIVGRGANQRPFKVVKFDEPPDTMKTKPKAEKIEKGATPDVEIHKIVFSGDNFTTKEAVQTFMEGEGYSNFVITQLENDFIVQAIAEEEFESIQPIKKEDGVVMFVGKLTTDAQSRKAAIIVNVTHEAPAATPEAAATAAAADDTKPAVKEAVKPAAKPAAKVDEVRTRTRSDSFLTVKSDQLQVRKINSYCDYYGCGTNCSNETTIEGVLKDMEDGVPVGYYDIHSAFVTALKNVILTDAFDQIPALTAEYGAVIQKLATLTGAVQKSDRDATIAKVFANTAGTPLNGVVQEIEGLDVLIAKALEPIMTRLGLLATKAELTPLQETVHKLSARVLNREAIRQERKGADADELTPAGEEEVAGKTATAKTDKEKDEKALKKGEQNLFGAR